ncbi:MAG: 30S ribosomal protein S17 [Candidatus Omnitrophota bacterium]
MTEKPKRKKKLEGIVVSDKMDKTIVVSVTKRQFHTRYKKMTVKKKRFKVHDEKNIAKIGNRVKIVESRPYSKEKCFRLLEVIH